MAPRLALIEFLDGLPYPSHPIVLPGPPGWTPPGGGIPGGPGGQPVYPDNSLPPFPSHPIAGYPWPPYQPPYPSTGPGFPTNPIQLPPWAGGWQPRPDNTLPPYGPGGGLPPHPWYPTFPTNPIQLPPWAGGWQPRPDNTLPPSGPGTIPPPPGSGTITPLPGQDPSGSKWIYAYVPGYGWMWAYVPVVPDAPKPPETGEGQTPEINPLT